MPATWIGIAPSDWTASDQARGRARAADLLDREAQREQVGAEAAVALRERDREDVVAREEPPDVVGPLGRPVDLGGPRGDLLVGQLADRVAQEDLLLGEADRAVGTVVGASPEAMLAAGHGGRSSGMTTASWRA